MLYTETVPVIDGCRIFERTRAYVAPAGVEATLQYTFRTSTGAPVRLLDTDQVFALARDPLSHGSRTHNANSRSDPIYRIECRLITEGSDPDTYIEKVEADLPDNLIDSPGVYGVQWAVFAEGAERPNRLGNSVLSIERSDWTKLANELARRKGPPTIDEIRYAIMDTGRGDNKLWNQSEFTADQILNAYKRPVLMWNEQRPLLAGYTYTTRNFPYREQWTMATAALLIQATGTSYMRNKSPVPEDVLGHLDKDYLAWADDILKQYKAFIVGQKTAISAGMCFGEVSSDYSLLDGRW